MGSEGCKDEKHKIRAQEAQVCLYHAACVAELKFTDAMPRAVAVSFLQPYVTGDMQLSYLSTERLSSSCPAELSRLPKELTFRRDPKPPHLLGDPRGEEGREVVGKEPLEPQLLPDDIPSASYSRPEAARCRSEL